MNAWLRTLLVAGFAVVAGLFVFNLSQQTKPILSDTVTTGDSLASAEETTKAEPVALFSKEQNPFDQLNRLKPGTTPPELNVKSTQGLVKLSDYADKNVILVFYQGYFCGVCGAQLEDLQANLSQFEAANTQIIGISADSMEKAEKTAGERGITFPLVPDPEHTIIEAYGIANRHKGGIAWPSVYIIKSDGTVQEAFADQVGTRLKTADLLPKVTS